MGFLGEDLCWFLVFDCFLLLARLSSTRPPLLSVQLPDHMLTNSRRQLEDTLIPACLEHAAARPMSLMRGSRLLRSEEACLKTFLRGAKEIPIEDRMVVPDEEKNSEYKVFMDKACGTHTLG